MKYAREFVTSTVIGGLFIVVPVYLAILLLLKGMKSAASFVKADCSAASRLATSSKA
jgi:cadmium resistance protein CadD (predicted permease)